MNCQNNQTDKKHRIGIFGGTFNPIHYGHLMIADNALHQFELDTVIFLPTGHSPHKPFMGEDMSVHRYEMVKLAIAGNDQFSISDYEINRSEVSYTYTTLAYFQEIYPDSELYFILGADSLFDFMYWKHPEVILQKAVVLAAVRDTMAEENVDRQIVYLKQKLGGQIYRLDSPNFSVSSNGIRSRVASGDTIRYLTPDSVNEYIKEHRLYSLIND